ncbi:MAG: hypothetical protein KJO82_03850, partial [Gammaproteobacteria bacterium]|nr:hypothetical protein [Gammaproteobacteria bacterium]
MLSRILIITGGLLVVVHAHAADPLACGNDLQAVVASPLRSSAEILPDDSIQFEVGELDAQFGPRPTAEMRGGVVLRQGDKLAGADKARFDPDQKALLLDGDVRYEDSGTQIVSE